MAIQFARARYISRSSGGSAIRSAAYNGRAAITAERTGELFSFRHRDAPEHHAVLLPEGAAERFRVSGVLWNAAEAAERRRDAQVAREIVVALPANAGVSTEDRIEMVRSFAEQHFVSQGLAVQLDVHAPHVAEEENEQANWHAHLLITTRRLETDGFAAKKARDLDPQVRRAGSRAVVADGLAWGELWREHQDRYFREHGIEVRVDPTATHAQEHIGPVRMRRVGAAIVERAEVIRQANEAAAHDPEQVLATLTRNNATFSERDLDRFLAKHIEAANARAAVKAKVFEHQGLLVLHDRETGETAERFTTRQVREEERDAMAAAGGLSRQKSGAVSERSARVATEQRTLRPDQAAAFSHAIGAGHLKLIEGRAGTGKSYTLAAVREAHERDGKRVVGLAPTNAVAQDLGADGFREARTVHAALFALKNGRSSWDRDTVVVVDEAAMLDTRVTGELLGAARQAGAKVILAGDDRQLASIERGGLFAELRQRHGAAEITEVTRQKVDWQRQATRDLAEGRFGEAVAAFDTAGAITWTQDQEDARKALVTAWTRDTAQQPEATRFVFAYTNRDVNALNADLRQVRRARGELGGPDVVLATKHGEAEFAIGDRVQFTDTDKKRHIYNGNVGTITGLDARTGEVTARLDAPGGAGRVVTWSADAFQGFRHGYAGTIYKGQGKTLDHTYLYHTDHWRSAASYVALTRQRESAQVFVARETARDAGQLARQMARGEVRSASIAWAASDELARVRTERTGGQEQAPTPRPAAPEKISEVDPAKAYWQSVGRESGGTGQWPRQGGLGGVVSGAEAREEDSLRAKVREALSARQRLNAKEERSEAAVSSDAQHQAAGRSAPEAEQAPAPLLPAWRDPTGQGRDSLGRGTSVEELARIANDDPAAMREVEAQKAYLRGAYRDPEAAGDALDALIAKSGNDLRIASQALRGEGAERLGALCGREGWLASQGAQADRVQARNAGAALASSLDREAAVRDAAVRHHTAEVDRQRVRDAVEVPGLSKPAQAALNEVQIAITATQDGRDGERHDARLRRQEEAVAGAWAAGRADPRVAAELDRFMAAANQRLGEEGVREALRAAHSGRSMTVPGIGKEHRIELGELARSVTLGRKGAEQSKAWEQRVEREAQATERERARQEERQRLGLPPESEKDRERQREGRGLSR
jgi:Ti-type conjugative transfer relaxase TraA